jgi:hypothetical protein
MQIYYDPTTGLYLSGTIADTELADGAVTSAKILDGTIVHGDVATANKDGTAATPSMRTLGTGAAQACAGNDSRVTGAAAAAQEAWREVGAGGQPAFESSWVYFGAPRNTAAFYKDTIGEVHLKGVVKNGTAAANPIFTLPAGYRPAGDALVASGSNSAFCMVQITSAGVVSCLIGGNTAWVSLDNIHFRAA